MKIREIALYTALVAGGAFAVDRAENYLLTRQMETERHSTQRRLSEMVNKLNLCQRELRKYETTNGGKAWRLNPDLSVNITGIDGTRTIEWRPEYQKVFENRNR